MVDAERLSRILRSVGDDVAVLRDYAGDRDGVRDDPAKLGHVKYLLITAVEGCIDAAQHVCAASAWEPPATNRDALDVIARHGVITTEVAADMKRAFGLRNVLVHRYREVDDELVIAALGRLDDIDSYLISVAALL